MASKFTKKFIKNKRKAGKNAADNIAAQNNVEESVVIASADGIASDVLDDSVNDIAVSGDNDGFDDLSVIDISSEVEYRLNQERTGIEVVKLTKSASTRAYNSFDLFFIKMWAAIVAFISYISEGISGIFSKIFKRTLPVRYVKAFISALLIILVIVIVLSPFNLQIGNRGENVTIFNNSLIPVCRTENGVEKWGYANKSGKEIIPCKFYDAEPFYNGVAFVKTDDLSWRLIGTDGKFKGDLIVRMTDVNEEKPVGDFNNSEKRAWIRESRDKYTFIKTNGSKAFKNIYYNYVESFSNGYAMVRVGEEYKFINKYGKVKSPVYKDAKSFSEGIAAVRKDSGWTFVNTSFKEIGKGAAYTAVTSFKNGYAWVRVGETVYLIDKNGKAVTPTDFVDLKPSDETLRELGAL